MAVLLIEKTLTDQEVHPDIAAVFTPLARNYCPIEVADKPSRHAATIEHPEISAILSEIAEARIVGDAPSLYSTIWRIDTLLQRTGIDDVAIEYILGAVEALPYYLQDEQTLLFAGMGEYTRYRRDQLISC